MEKNRRTSPNVRLTGKAISNYCSKTPLQIFLRIFRKIVFKKISSRVSRKYSRYISEPLKVQPFLFLTAFPLFYLEMRERKMAAYLQQHQMNFQLSQLAMQSPFYRMPFRPQNLDPRIQSLLFLQMRSPSVASSQRAQLQAMFNSMSPETRQAFLMSLNNAHSKTGQPNVPGK